MIGVFVLSLLLLSSLVSGQQGVRRPCGYKLAPCPDDYYCSPVDDNCSDLNFCPGQCLFKNQYPQCGGYRLKPKVCPWGTICQRDPRITRNLRIFDIAGVCIPKEPPTCRGIIGKACPEGLYCYDKPGGGCDPENGGADCIGICL